MFICQSLSFESESRPLLSLPGPLCKGHMCNAPNWISSLRFLKVQLDQKHTVKPECRVLYTFVISLLLPLQIPLAIY